MSVYEELMNEARKVGGSAPRRVGKKTRPRSERGMPPTPPATPDKPTPWKPKKHPKTGAVIPGQLNPHSKEAARSREPTGVVAGSTEYEGPSLSEQRDFIKRFLDEGVKRKLRQLAAEHPGVTPEEPASGEAGKAVVRAAAGGHTRARSRGAVASGTVRAHALGRARIEARKKGTPDPTRVPRPGRSPKWPSTQATP